MNFFLRGLAIGFAIAAPVGPIGILIGEQKPVAKRRQFDYGLDVSANFNTTTTF